KSGIDFSHPGLTSTELALVLAWYTRILGEVPGYVRFLARDRPHLLKAHRNRYENTIRNGLPKQMLPYLLLHYDVIRGFKEGIRENVLLARAFGVKKEYVVGVMCRAMTSYGGPAALSVAEDAVGDVLENWTDAEGQTPKSGSNPREAASPRKRH